MRALMLSLALCSTACSGGGDTDETDRDPDSDTECHPNVPEEYCFLWNSDGCTTQGGAPANQVYYIFEGSTDADGNFSGTETMYWFYPMEGWEDDCIDKMKLTGEPLRTDPSLLGCVGCEELYTVRRELVEDNCSWGYNGMYEEDKEGYFSTILLDTLNFSGEPNEDNKVQVLHREWSHRNETYSTKDYAIGHIYPEGSEHGPPAKYDWVGGKCKGR